MLNLVELADQLRELNRIIDSAEATGGQSSQELLRTAAIYGCRVYTDLLEDHELEQELAEGRRVLEEYSDEAWVTIQERQDGLIRAEIRLLQRLGLEDDLLGELEEELFNLDLAEIGQAPSLDHVYSLREQLCSLKQGLRHEQKRSKRSGWLWGGVMGLGALAIAGGNGALIPASGALSSASLVLSGGLLESARRRATD